MKTVSPFILLVSIMFIISSANSFSQEPGVEDESPKHLTFGKETDTANSTEPQQIDSTEIIIDNIIHYIFKASSYIHSYNFSEKFKAVVLESYQNDNSNIGAIEFLDSLYENELHKIRIKYGFNSASEFDSLLALYDYALCISFDYDQINDAKSIIYLRLAVDEQFMSKISGSLHSYLKALCEENKCRSKEDLMNLLKYQKAFIESDDLYNDIKSMILIAKGAEAIKEILGNVIFKKIGAEILEIGKKYGFNSKADLNKNRKIYENDPEIDTIYDEIGKSGMAIYKRMANDEELMSTLPEEIKEILKGF